ncbi:MazG-like family protein [Streptomyces sp. NPDC056728]
MYCHRCHPALVGDGGELLDIFQWLTPAESTAAMGDPVRSARVREEMADVFAHLLRMADVLDLDVEQALADKIEGDGRTSTHKLRR